MNTLIKILALSLVISCGPETIRNLRSNSTNAVAGSDQISSSKNQDEKPQTEASENESSPPEEEAPPTGDDIIIGDLEPSSVIESTYFFC